MPRSAPFPWRRVWAILSVGVGCAVLAAGLSRGVARLALSGADDGARRRVERAAQTTFDSLASLLREDAGRLARADLLVAGARGDTSALRQLFSLAASMRGDDGQVDLRSITVYGDGAQPLAWAGSPSELTGEQLAGGERWFLIPGALGVRLAYLTPVLSPDREPLGVIVAERALDIAAPRPADAGFVMTAGGVPVALDLSARPDAGADGRLVDLTDPAGQVLATARIGTSDIERAERRLTRAGTSAALIIAALALVLACGPLLGWWWRAPTSGGVGAALLACAAAVAASRVMLRLSSPADYLSSEVFSGAVYASALVPPLLASPFDFLVSALGAVALLALALSGGEHLRRHRLVPRLPVSTPLRALAFASVQLTAGATVLGVLLAHRYFIGDTVANTSLEALQLSLHPWDLARVCLQVGLVIWHLFVVGLSAGLLYFAGLPWRLPRRRRVVRVGMAALWAAPWVVWSGVARSDLAVPFQMVAATGASILLATLAPRFLTQYRQGSQALRLAIALALVVVPSLVCYPMMFSVASAARRELVESSFAPQAINQRQTIQRILQESLAQIDGLETLDSLVSTPAAPDDPDAMSERAFDVWRATSLAGYPVTSSIELFDGAAQLVSRFAFNLPEELAGTPSEQEDQCSWTIYEEVSPFFAEERRVLHAGRALCAPGGTATVQARGAIVVHAILDYANLPFIASQNPYVELLRPGGTLIDESSRGRDVEYAVYGWSGRPLFASAGTPWPLDDGTLARVAAARDPAWVRLERDGTPYNVYIQNDRGGIYALGFPLLPALGHMVNLAELVVLGTVAGLLFMGMSIALDLSRGHATTGRVLLREVRESFYRKLFIAFVAASAVPVITLAILTRNYIADQFRTGVEQEAVRTVAAARRVVEDLAVPRGSGAPQAIDDNLLVWVSRLIDQDVNVFRGVRLQATSERNLFASGVLPMRTPADAYRTLQLETGATAIVTDRAGSLPYLVAATPLTTRQFDGVLTVPLTLRQRDIEDQIDTLNRLVLLGALLFIVGGAGIGYSLAERIADPVNRLTRATRRIASGELDVRVAATSSDELRRLVDDFNRMAKDLQRQRAELERTHRLAAWAEMARQVAHEIKNPLTPIQLNAEHVRRVHADRGRPLSPVLEECVANILSQVSLLRTIASEFSNFASQPAVQRASVALSELVTDVMAPYRGVLDGRVAIVIDVPPDLPPVVVDRVLLSRAVANLVENALHAMPAGGTLTLVATRQSDRVALAVVDTGVGMDSDALSRAFEPYFSTKVSGTGLGLPIARRNVELSGGAVTIDSIVGGGTTVTVSLPTN